MFRPNRAAYKGFADTVRLLLFRDASQGRQDKEGMLFRCYFQRNSYRFPPPVHSRDCNLECVSIYIPNTSEIGCQTGVSV